MHPRKNGLKRSSAELNRMFQVGINDIPEDLLDPNEDFFLLDPNEDFFLLDPNEDLLDPNEDLPATRKKLPRFYLKSGFIIDHQDMYKKSEVHALTYDRYNRTVILSMSGGNELEIHRVTEEELEQLRQILLEDEKIEVK